MVTLSRLFGRGRSAETQDHGARPDCAESGGENFEMGLELARRGLHAEALKEFKRAAARQPAHAETYFNIGITFAQLGQPGEAVKAYQKALRLRADYVEAYNNLGLTFTKMGQHLEAI